MRISWAPTRSAQCGRSGRSGLRAPASDSINIEAYQDAPEPLLFTADPLPKPLQGHPVLQLQSDHSVVLRLRATTATWRPEEGPRTRMFDVLLDKVEDGGELG
mmetsp:Transcript_8744/g.26885  ORF Transcript_8744/g.26885 Transcript_8744/m.26885 type:complete len:103 (+) Transcript_8744:1278-1586(+)